ncbi:D-alanyl-D-alanine-carboxypeptidase/endopeptidase AmpH [Rosenbergiella epipactidis]|uniref:D-alanyl-D-alanine- carboxypeptidase/endopeptidase AmpH n=1 Tax=Rosenbergiella epipactidis TaxID=1544694 RepID=UPI0023DF3F55|nr:D-alanyl-D-alanine-carboxypeptidase/endopeptidase AmpH [Rosenbergiella epipactidis]
MDRSPLKKLTLSLVAALVLSATSTSFAAPRVAPQVSADIVQRYAQQIYQQTAAASMTMVVIDGNQHYFTSAGETRRGTGVRPTKESVFRLASISKLFTSETLVKLDQQGVVKLSDPLSKYTPKGMMVPSYRGYTIKLQNLATHTAGLPREMPGGRANRPVFIWPEKSSRWQWLQHAKLKAIPGTVAAYSNLGFDYLADALSRASGKPYPQLVQSLITRPLGMKDTTFTPSPDQCRRLIIPRDHASPCNNTLAAIGSGGLYSTADDMERWMQQFLSSSIRPRSPLASTLQRVVYPRSQLVRMNGMDVAGPASGLGLGWVHMDAIGSQPALVEKTGGGGGFMTYIVMDPRSNVGVFIAVARAPGSHFTPMSQGANQLVTALVNNR